MSQPLSEYFAQEAGEYLDRLDELLARGDAPDPVEFFRVARGVRGSAQLAGAEAVARVAEGLEEGARALRDGALVWNDEVRGRALETAVDLRVLVTSPGPWGAEQENRAQAAAARWDGAGAARRRAESGQPAGQIFDFLHREIGGVVAELDRALGELANTPDGREPLRAVLRRMRPVRGVAGMDSLSPVLEMLEAIEDVAHQVMGRSGPVESREVEVLGASRDALAAAAAALEKGQGVGEGAELDRFRQVRDRDEGRAEAGESGVVPVASLFFAGAGPHVVSSPLAPSPPGEGEERTLAEEAEGFLRMEATGFLDRAEGLLAGLAARPTRFTRIARELRDLAAGVGQLAVTYGMTAVAAAADEASAHLGRASSPEDARGALSRLRGAIPGVAPLPVVEVEPPEAESAPQPRPAVPAAPAPGQDGVVPIGALVYDAPDALREALAMRDRIVALVQGGGGDEFRQALDELFGLVELGLAGNASAGG
jgi:HPt (histidine-containing phosphotransfer) domain-containing protein